MALAKPILMVEIWYLVVNFVYSGGLEPSTWIFEFRQFLFLDLIIFHIFSNMTMVSWPKFKNKDISGILSFSAFSMCNMS